MLIDELEQSGFAVLSRVYSPQRVDSLLADLTSALNAAVDENEGVRSQEGSIYAARNVLDLWPELAHTWPEPRLLEVLRTVLGPGFGLVRVLFFDKPPERTWALPWHKDLTIAVRENCRPSPHFGKPTCKAGIPHVEAPQAVLEAMLTARIHLDDITEENGPLKVIPGSHRTGKTLEWSEVPERHILVNRGDVLLMRPLLVHCSNRSHPETRRHRRILHLEFAASKELPDGYGWHHFSTP